jgi:predicted ATPase
MQLSSVSLRNIGAGDAQRFPFSVPAVAQLGTLELTTPVTMLVGENGSGKSTLLEGLAAATGLPTVGTEGTDRDPTLAHQRTLAKALKLVWKRRTHRGFFLRAEDFFGFAKQIVRLRAEMFERIAELEEEYRERSAYAKGLAQGPLRASIADLERRYGVDPDASSHGQSFLRLFQSRFVPDGLYILDEPEAALSPQSQLALIALIADGVAQSSQFIIATHSPIVLAYPGATLFSFDRTPPAAVTFDELDHVSLTRSFLNDPHSYLRHLFPSSATERETP